MSDPMSFRSLTIATPKLKNLTRLEKLIPHRNGFLNAKMKRLMLDDVKTANFWGKNSEDISFEYLDKVLPKGTTVLEVGNAFLKKGYRIKIFNTINFKKSMHYNPFVYIHSEKDILKLVTTLMTNTRGEGKGGDPFWDKAEKLLLTSLIAYIHYEAPEEEQNFATLLEFLNIMEVREDDEEFQNPVDLMFEDLAKEKPDHFAVRQYRLYKLAAGVIECRQNFNIAWFKPVWKMLKWTIQRWKERDPSGKEIRTLSCALRTPEPRRWAARRIQLDLKPWCNL